MNPTFSQYFAPMLKSLFNNKSHAYKLRPRPVNQINNTIRGIPVCKEVINKKHTILLTQEIFTDTNIIFPIFCKRSYRR